MSGQTPKQPQANANPSNPSNPPDSSDKSDNSVIDSASAATVAQANLNKTVSEALAVASLNAVQAQQQTNILHQTVTATGMAQMYASSIGIRRWAGVTYGNHLGMPITDHSPVNPSQDVAQVLSDMEAIANFLKNASTDNPPSSDSASPDSTSSTTSEANTTPQAEDTNASQPEKQDGEAS